MFVVIGLPVWYFTTSTYRATLPFNEIYEISSLSKIEYASNFDLVYLNTELFHNKMKTIENKLKEESPKGIYFFLLKKI